MNYDGHFVVCPKCGWAGYTQKEGEAHCPMPKCRTPMQKVQEIVVVEYLFKSAQERDAMAQEAREKYCQNRDPKLWEEREAFDRKTQRQAFEAKMRLENQPKCPTCGSTNISRISGLERGASIFAWGLFSKKINKTFKCNNPNCGYTW